MEELFRVETQRVSFVWYRASTRKQSSAGTTEPGGDARGAPSGLVCILPRRRDLILEAGTHRYGVPNIAARDLQQSAGPPLFEETTYTVLLSSRSDAPLELRHRDPLLLQDIHPTDDRRLWHGSLNFRSQVGTSRFAVLVGGSPEFDLEVEVFPSKVEYRADYAAMMGEVQDLAAGLALEYLRATHHLGQYVGGREASRLDWIALLRHLVDDLEQAVAYIAQRPIRGLFREPQMVRVEMLRRSDGALRQAVRAGIGRGARITLGSGVPVRRYLPERRPQQTLDTPEHRWLAMQLKQTRLRLVRVIREEVERQRMMVRRQGRTVNRSDRDVQALVELETLESRITRLERTEPLAAASGPPPQGFTSLQLQGAPGYREAYRTLTVLRQGLHVGGGPVELSVKDVHLLYEYWCFLGILRLVAEILQTPIPADKLLEVRAEGLRVRLKQGVTQAVPFELPGGRTLQVTYNPSFQDRDALLPQQPDLVLTLTDPNWPTVRLVLDAKYRVEDDTAFVQRFGVAGPPADAVNVLHRYRDAILESDGELGDVPDIPSTRPRRTVIEGAALYPLDAERARAFGESQFWRALERLGIGAVPFLPGSVAWLERWLRRVLRRSGWDVADAVISHAAEVTRTKWKRAAEVPVLVGVLRSHNTAEHLAWIRQERTYYTRLTPSQSRQLRVGIVAIYGPAHLYGPEDSGRVELWAPVEAIEVIPRREISTPWPPGGTGDELQVLYRLGEWRKLSRPVVNRSMDGRAQPFRSNRWASELGLHRATDATELLLETVAEWELYDGLVAQGTPFFLRAARSAGEMPGEEGRAWFIVDHTRVRVVGLDTVELHRAGQIERFHPRRILAELDTARS
jgi:uncharacterized protein